jgi:branched-chain amino acid transport system substrate-binding protein
LFAEIKIKSERPEKGGKKMTKGAIGVLCMVMMVFVTCGVTSAEETKRPIKIGVLYTKTGLLAEHGRQADMGIALALEELNAKGGVLGRKIQAVWRDDQSKAEVTTRETNALLFEEKVDVLLGTLLGNTGNAVSPISKEQKVPFIVLTQIGNLTMEDGHRYIFRGVSSSIMNSRAHVLNLLGKGFRTAWTITFDYSFGHQIIASTKEYMARKVPEIKIIGESWPPLSETDFTPYISQIMRAKPDVVIAYIFGTGMAAFLKQAKPLGFFDKIKIALDCNPDNIRPLGLDFMPGVLGWAFYDITLDEPNNRSFVKHFRDKYKEYPAFAAAVFYTGVHSFAKAIEIAGSTDREAIVDALEKVKVSCPYGEIYYRTCDHQGSFPVVVGETSVMPGEKWYLLGTNARGIPADQLWPSCEEVMEVRKAAQKK